MPSKISLMTAVLAGNYTDAALHETVDANGATRRVTVAQMRTQLFGVALPVAVLASSLTTVGVLASPHMTSPTVDSGTTTLQAVVAASVTVTGTLAAANVVATGAAAANVANTTRLVYAGSSTGTWIVNGADVSTNGLFSLRSVRSDGSGAISVLVSDAAGAITIGGLTAGNIAASRVAVTASTGVTNATGTFGYNSVVGTYIAPKAGSGADFTLYNDAGSAILTIFGSATTVAGPLTFSALAGVGTRNVVVNAAGVLSAP